jgi:Fe-S cluster assembly iron-binding protein IscA
MVKDAHGYDVKVPTQGQSTYNSVAGSLGIASFLGLNAGNILGGCGGGLFGNRNGGCVSPADMPVTRYEMAMQQEIASKDSKIALLEANTYQDQKSLELYKYVDSKFNSINEVLAAQAVRNQAINDSIQSLDYKTMQAIALEAERRQCADCKIVNYVNSTFAPRLITDYTAGTTSAVAQVYNPLACGQCGCGGGNTFAGPTV